MHLGWSSHVYPLSAADVAKAADYAGPAIDPKDLPDDEVVLLIRKGAPDALLRGRAAVESAAAKGGAVAVRVVFVPAIAKWNILRTVSRILRERRRFKGTGVYHVDVTALRRMGLERAVRTLDNPQARRGKDRASKMAKLEESLREHGYDDGRPMTVMLCRSRGIEDSIRQGHHRISACISCGIKTAAIRFSAAGALPRPLARFVGRPSKDPGVVKGALESACGKPVCRVIPLGDRPLASSFIVVPEPGGRFVMDLSSDRLGNVSGVSDKFGLASAILMPLIVAAAIVIDVAVMKTAAGSHSVVAWGQFVLGAAACAMVAVPAAAERRARAGYLALASTLASMSGYELLRGVFDVDSDLVGPLAAAVAVLSAALLAVFSRRSFAAGARRLFLSRGASALPFGFLFVFGISKILGSRRLWSAMMSTEKDVKIVKHVLEEWTEFFGYAVIVCWAILFLADRIANWRRRI